MPDFSHLSALEQKDDARPYKFEQIGGAPTIWFRPATDVNKRFQNEAFRKVNARSGRSSRGARLTDDVLQESREEDKQLFAYTCATKWDVKDAQGATVEFTPENCLEYLRLLPNWLFDEMRAWLTNAANFIDAPQDGTALGEA